MCYALQRTVLIVRCRQHWHCLPIDQPTKYTHTADMRHALTKPALFVLPYTVHFPVRLVSVKCQINYGHY